MSRNRFLIDLPPKDADALRSNAAREHLTVTAHIKRVLLLDNDRREAGRVLAEMSTPTPPSVERGEES